MDYNDKPDILDPEALAHFGVKGMRWGHHKAPEPGSGGGGGGVAPAKSNRQLNKEFRQKQKQQRDAEIEAARQRYGASARENYLKAKEQYKQDKKTIGTAAARAKFNAVKEQNINDYEIASQAKSGKETTAAVLATVGTVALFSVLGAVAQNVGGGRL